MIRQYLLLLARRPIVVVAIVWILLLLGLDALMRSRPLDESDKWDGDIELIGTVVSDVERVGEQNDKSACWAFLFRTEKARIPGEAWEGSSRLVRVKWFAGI